MAAGGEHEEVLPVPLRRCTCLTHNVVSFPGEGRERPPRFYSTPLSASSVGRPRAQIVQAGRVRRRANGSEARAPEPFLACEVVTGHLWPGTPPQGLRSENPGPFPWTEIQCLGLQSYSRL